MHVKRVKLPNHRLRFQDHRWARHLNPYEANASERVNRSVISGIRSYVCPNQNDWDESLNKIFCALRSSVHSSIGTTPYYLASGQHMVTDGPTYCLLRR